jgi:hypothetical protein
LGENSLRAIRIRFLALVVVCVASAIQAGSAGAQDKKAASDDNTGFIGIPEYTSSETGIPFFFDTYALVIDRAFKEMRAAIAKCDRAAYRKARALMEPLINPPPYPSDAPPIKKDPVRDAHLYRDSQNAREALEKAPPFPDDCKPPSELPLINLWLLGGSLIALNSSSNVTGVDTFLGSGDFRISNQSGGTGTPTGLVGTRVRIDFEIPRPTRSFFPDGVPLIPSRFFLEAGVQSGFGAQSFIQSFQAISTTPQAFGSNTINENLQVPLVAGLTLPIGTSGSATPSVLFDVYGGITLDSWTQTLQGRESGAPGGPGFFGQNRRFTVDPTVGVGVRVPVGDFGGLPGLMVGVNAELQFRPGSVVTATSSNFPSETYYGTVNPMANLAIMARIGIPLGGR